MKILLIAYSFLPSEDPQSIRWYFLSDILGKQGAKIDIVTVQTPKEIKGWIIHKNIRIHRVYAGLIGSHIMKFKKKMGVEDSENNRYRRSIKFRVIKRIYKIIMTILNNIIPGDLRTEWFPYAVLYIQNSFKLSDYDFIITSHEPGVDSLLGMYLKRLNSRMKWVSDFGDPYVSPLYTSVMKLWYERFFERLIYQNADVLVFTTTRVVEQLRARYSFFDRKRILIIEQGLSLTNVELAEKDSPRNEVFTLLYTGTFYKKFRNPSNLIKALLQIDFDFEFILAGRNEEFLKDFSVLGNRFKYMGLINHFNVIDLQKKTDVLVHISNMDSLQFPGKFYEYLAARKPILSLVHEANDPSIDLIKSLNCGVYCMDHPLAIKLALETLHERWLVGYNSHSFNTTNLYEHSWEKKGKILWNNLIMIKRANYKQC